jgi:hypothetical protein
MSAYTFSESDGQSLFCSRRIRPENVCDLAAPPQR